jgi:hypothetical protein
MYTKQCKICYQGFLTDRYNKVCCSDDHHRLYRNLYMEKRREVQRTHYNKLCKRCGKEFRTFWSRKIFCSHQCERKYWDKVNSDKKPRKTNKSYNVADALQKQHLTERQKAIVLGTLLGDGCLIKSGNENSTLYRLSWTHGEPQKEYIEWKHQEMKPFTMHEPMKYIRKNDNGFLRKDGLPHITYHLFTIGHNDLSYIKGLLYRGKKKFVTRRYLNLLTPLSLAVWYMDDGSYGKRNHGMMLCTHSMTLSEHRAMKAYFWQRWNIDCKISDVNKEYKGEMRHYYCLRFGVKATEQFQEIVKSYIISSMQYKLNPQRLIRLSSQNENKTESTLMGDHKS